MSLSSSKQSSQSQLDPAFRDAYLANLESAKGVSGGLQAREFAGFTPDQLASFDVTRQFADPNSQQMQQLGTAGTLATSAGLYRPQQVQSREVQAALANAAQLGRGNVRDVSNIGVTGQQVAQEALGAIAPQARANIRDVAAGSFLNQNIQDYMNP